jgi:hypothetical protein
MFKAGLSQGDPAVKATSVSSNPGDAFGLLSSGVISGTIAGYSVFRKEGLQQGLTVGFLVFFGVTTVKMFYDIWKRP